MFVSWICSTSDTRWMTNAACLCHKTLWSALNRRTLGKSNSGNSCAMNYLLYSPAYKPFGGERIEIARVVRTWRAKVVKSRTCAVLCPDSIKILYMFMGRCSVVVFLCGTRLFIVKKLIPLRLCTKKACNFKDIRRTRYKALRPNFFSEKIFLVHSYYILLQN